MTIPSLALGAEIVRCAAASGRPVSNLSLQKLAYLCHGFYLAVTQSPLVEEEFEAWRLGPVLPSLYHTYKPFASNPVPADHPIVTANCLSPDRNPEEIALIADVLDQYARYSSTALVHLSHEAGGPWHQVWQAPSSDGTIPHDLIRDYFSHPGR